MTTVFGRGIRGRRKATEETEVASIADEANLWWTRRDFVQHAVVNPSRTTTSIPSDLSTPPPAYTPSSPRPDAAPHATAAHSSAPRAKSGGSARTNRATTPPPAPPVVEHDVLDGRSFAEVFSTESLFAPDSARAASTRTAAAPKAKATSTTSHCTEAAADAPSAPAEPAAKARKRLPANHPLLAALHTLGLGPEATWPEVQHAYRVRAKEAHPDRTGDNGEAMATINGAYRSLRDGQRYGLFGDD